MSIFEQKLRKYEQLRDKKTTIGAQAVGYLEAFLSPGSSLSEHHLINIRAIVADWEAATKEIQAVLEEESKTPKGELYAFVVGK